MLTGMALPVTYVELYFRRLEVFRRLHNQESDPWGTHDAGISSDRHAPPKARSEVTSRANHRSETSSIPHLTAHVEASESVVALDHSGLISAHVPERGVTRNDNECGPFHVGERRFLDSAIPPSPTAIKRHNKRQQAEQVSILRSKIPRRPVPHDAWVVRSHPLAYGVIKLCQFEESTLRNRKRRSGSKTKQKNGSSGPQPALALRQTAVDSQPAVSEVEAGLSERELSFTDSLSLTGDFLRPPPSMYCTLTSEQMLLQHMQLRSESGFR